MSGLTIAVDVMGGDFGPQVTVPASVQALSYYPSLKLILVGDQSQITENLLALKFESDPRISIIHTTTVISNDMRPSHALRFNSDSSMRLALDLVAKGEANACISAGNTGALMALSRMMLKLLPGIDRPALVTALPSVSEKPAWLLDLGANVSVDADTLFQFAVMGSVLAEARLGRKPRVALLNIGEEEIKGNDLVKRCAEMLKQTTEIDYIGYIEGDQLYNDKTDVIVCDGFVGNVCLKTSEGVARLVLNKMKFNVSNNKFKQILIKWLLGDLFNSLNTLNPDHYNGASLLGLRGIVVKSHGNADISAFQCAIKEAVYEVERQLPQKICDRLEAVLVERHS